MTEKTENDSFKTSCLFFIAMSIVFCTAAICVYFLLPTDEKVEPVEIIAEIPEEPVFEEIEPTFVNYLNEISIGNGMDYEDDGLRLYRDPISRPAVEWFYGYVTGSQEVASAILFEAEKNDIPLSLAFALAYTESRYKTNAVNKNSNTSIDRGLFQLNSNSFKFLTESEFFDPAISAKYGMSHLRFCIDTAGNTVSALAMYNAGTVKVRSNNTPQSTLNYIYKIMAYQEIIEKLFEDEVSSCFEPQFLTGFPVAMTNKN